MISGQDLAIRIVIAAMLGAMVGYERRRNGQPAGMRINILLVVGITLITTLSIQFFSQIRPLVTGDDSTLLTIQIVSGIGFLGAGSMAFYGAKIKGLTTATSLWAMTMVGLSLGAGNYLQGAAGTAVLMVCLILLNEINKHFHHANPTALLIIIAEDRKNLMNDISLSLTKTAGLTSKPWVSKSIRNQRIRIECAVTLSNKFSIGQILETLIKIEGVQSVKID